MREVKSALGKKYRGRAALCYSAWNVFGLTESYDYFENVLDTDVHGNIAWDPIFINPQVFPKHLKEQVTEKYKSYLDKIEFSISHRNKRIHRFVNQNMNFLNAKDESKYFEQFLRYTRQLDESRNTNVVDVIPELKDYV